MINVELQVEDYWGEENDWQTLAESAVIAALKNSPHLDLITAQPSIEISISFSDDLSVQALNASYRGKDKPTNVLSFPMVQADLISSLSNSDDGEILFGDMILAHGVCEQEAADKGIAMKDHATHLIVHATYHLLGYDHIEDDEAEAMEELEITALASMGIANPY